jgi:DNA-binding response OmpR family regulator
VEADVLKSECLRALVVDDVADTADSLALLLRLWGYHAQICYGGAAALEVARSYRPHVVLLDIGLPGMDGFEVALRLREMPGLEDTVLIGISGHSGESHCVHAREAGFDHYLIKPEDPVHLRMLLTRTVRSTASRTPEELPLRGPTARVTARGANRNIEPVAVFA